MKRTSIEWTDFSSNPIRFRDAAGLTPFLDERELKHILNAKTVGGEAVSGKRAFVSDMTDVFGEWVPDEMRDRLFAVMALRPDVTFQLLTKRPERMAEYFRTTRTNLIATAAGVGNHFPWPLPNLWLGTSVENQATADERIPHLLATPAAVRFLSVEPLLGPVDLARVSSPCGYTDAPHAFDCLSHDLARGRWFEGDGERARAVDWVIVGAESGSGRRPMAEEWAHSLVEQCAAAGVNCFVKQVEVGGKVSGEVETFPLTLRVREFAKDRP